MKIEIEITGLQIAYLMCSAIESGDPVTTASRGGWCNGVNLIEGKAAASPWYTDENLWAGAFVIEIIEVDDESAKSYHETKHLG